MPSQVPTVLSSGEIQFTNGQPISEKFSEFVPEIDSELVRLDLFDSCSIKEGDDLLNTARKVSHAAETIYSDPNANEFSGNYGYRTREHALLTTKMYCILLDFLSGERGEGYVHRLNGDMKVFESMGHILTSAAYFHDAGKLPVLEVLEIMSFDGPFPDGLRELYITYVKLHPLIGSHIAQRLGFPQEVINIAGHHHEKPSGNGYPYRLFNGQTEFYEKLLSVADVLASVIDPMKVHKKSLSSVGDLRMEISRISGIQLDSASVGIASDMITHMIGQNVAPNCTINLYDLYEIIRNIDSGRYQSFEKEILGINHNAFLLHSRTHPLVVLQ